jgi:hypothetical protein
MELLSPLPILLRSPILIALEGRVVATRNGEVRVDKMRAYNQVNLQAGFGLLSIVSPREIRFDDED